MAAGAFECSNSLCRESKAMLTSTKQQIMATEQQLASVVQEARKDQEDNRWKKDCEHGDLSIALGQTQSLFTHKVQNHFPADWRNAGDKALSHVALDVVLLSVSHATVRKDLRKSSAANSRSSSLAGG